MSKSILQKKRILTKSGGGSSLATPVSVPNGGTGISSYAIGDIIYASGATTLSKLPIGTASQQLRVNAGATALEYFTPTSSGITANSTTITSGTSTRIGFNDSGVYGENSGLTYNKTTGYLAVGGGTSLGALSLYGGGLLIGIASGNTGITIGSAIGSSNAGVLIGTGGSAVVGNYGVAIGYNPISSGAGSITLGIRTINTYSTSIAIGIRATTTAESQCVIGGSSTTYGNSNGITDFIVGKGVTSTTALSVNFTVTSGSGTDNVGGNFNIKSGFSTGAGSASVINLYGYTVGSAGTATAQTASIVQQITNSTLITYTDAVNFAIGTTTGTKIGTTTTQKIGFWGVTPVTQYATTGTTTGFTANASANTLFNESTFTGDTGATAYTISDLVKALKLCGIILS
jgi:hypothetical protein